MTELGDSLAVVIARLARAVALLREVGFSHLYATGEARRCRCCLTDTADGETEVHAPDCKLAALLKETDD